MATRTQPRYQVIISTVRRDGLHNVALSETFHDLATATQRLRALELKALPFQLFNIRGVLPGEDPRPVGFRPRVRDTRPAKLYAVKASPYPEGKEPAGYVAPWLTAWGRTEDEARRLFCLTARERRAYHIHEVKELTLGQEREILAAWPNLAERLRLARRYGEEAVD